MRELVLDAGRCYIPFLLLFHGALYLVSLSFVRFHLSLRLIRGCVSNVHDFSISLLSCFAQHTNFVSSLSINPSFGTQTMITDQVCYLRIMLLQMSNAVSPKPDQEA
jgi:hypothetical protein